MQKAIQQNARKTANHLRGYRTEVLRKISAVKVRTKIASEAARQTLAHNCRNLAQIAGTSCALRPDWAEILSRGRFSTKFGVETGKMNSATRRNRFYAKRRPERMKRHPVWRKMGSSMCVCVLRRDGAVYGRFRSSFRRSRVPTAAYGIYSSNRVRMQFPHLLHAWTTDSRGSEPTQAC